jgi:hypothetical protein
MTPEDEHSALVDVVRWIDEHHSGIVLPADERSRMTAGCFDVAIEHQAAIALLSSGQLYGPMFALLRVLTESVVRGLWLAQCASDTDLAKFKKHRLDKDFAQLIQEIEQAIGYAQSPLSKLKTNSWKAMNGFTHTGFYQVARRNGPGTTGPNYPPEEISQALALAGALGLIAASQLAGLAGTQPLLQATMTRMKAYANRAL